MDTIKRLYEELIEAIKPEQHPVVGESFDLLELPWREV